MPGFELINKKNELKQIKDIFDNGCVFYRYGFEKKEIIYLKLKNLRIGLQKNLILNMPLASLLELQL